MWVDGEKLEDLTALSQKQWNASAWALQGGKTEVRWGPRNPRFLPMFCPWLLTGNVKTWQCHERKQKVFSLLLLKYLGYNQSYSKKLLYFGSMWKRLFAFQYVQLILPIKTWDDEEEIRPLEWKTRDDILQTFQIKRLLACNISVDVPIFLNDWVFKWDQSACKWGNRIKTSPISDWVEKLSKGPFFISNFHHKRSNFQLPLLLLTAFHCACQLIAAAVFRGKKRSSKW